MVSILISLVRIMTPYGAGSFQCLPSPCGSDCSTSSRRQRRFCSVRQIGPAAALHAQLAGPEWHVGKTHNALNTNYKAYPNFLFVPDSPDLFGVALTEALVGYGLEHPFESVAQTIYAITMDPDCDVDYLLIRTLRYQVRYFHLVVSAKCSAEVAHYTVQPARSGQGMNISNFECRSISTKKAKIRGGTWRSLQASSPLAFPTSSK
jgi:hypothetical protein